MSAAPLMLSSSVMMMRWSGRPELNSRRDSSWRLGLVSSLRLTRIPQRVRCVGGDCSWSGSSKWPENILDNGSTSSDFSLLNLPIRVSVRKTQTKSWRWKSNNKETIFWSGLNPHLTQGRERILNDQMFTLLSPEHDSKTAGTTQLLLDQYFPWEMSTLPRHWTVRSMKVEMLKIFHF